MPPFVIVTNWCTADGRSANLPGLVDHPLAPCEKHSALSNFQRTVNPERTQRTIAQQAGRWSTSATSNRRLASASDHQAKQANAERFVARELMKTIATALDQAIINGSGASGQPTGLLNTAGIQTESGTTLNAGTLAMKRKSAAANADDARIVFLSTPAVRELLETRERATGGGRFVWDGERVADRPAYVSTDIPTATMIAGDFGNVYVGIWGAGFVVEINPHDPVHFKTGVIQARIILSADVAVLHPAAFVTATSIT